MRLLRVRNRTAIFTAALLAIGVGAAGSVFSVVRALSPLGLPYPNADRLVVLRAGSPSWSPAMLEALSVLPDTPFDHLAGIQERSATITGDGSPEVLRLESVSATYFDLVGAAAARGRVFSGDEDRRNGSSPVAVISHNLWRQRFGQDDAIVGRRITIDGHSLSVIGVMPPRFSGLIGRTDIWTPLGSARWLSGDTGPERPSSRWFEVIARRRAGIGGEQAAAFFASSAKEALRQLPNASQMFGANARFTTVPLSDARVPPVFPRAARILAIAVASILLLVIVNAVSLHLVRLDERARELAIRLAIGADLRHVTALAVKETSAIALGGIAGALLARPLMLSWLARLQPRSTGFGVVTSQLLTERVMSLDGTTLVFTVVVGVLAASPLTFGLILKARRMSVERVLRGSGAARTGLARWFSPSTGLVALQASLACAVIGTGVLLAHGTARVLQKDRGYTIDGITIGRLSLPDSYDAAGAVTFYERVTARLAALPGVSGASLASCAPGAGRCRLTNVNIADGRPIERANQPQIGLHYAAPGFFETIDATVTAGRSFNAHDTHGNESVAMITETLAEKLWPAENPIGHTLEVFTANGSLNGARTVVGTVRPIAYAADNDPGLDVFLPAAQAAWASGVLFVRGDVTPRAIADTVAALDPTLPVSEVGPLSAPLGRSLSIETFLQKTILAFGVVGVLLAAFGVYSVVTQTISRGEREIGLRMALGATPGDVRRLVGRQAAVVAVAGTIAGTAGALWAGGLLKAFLHGLSPRDPLAIASGPIVIVAAVMAASLWPALKAAKLNPTSTMKS